MKKRLFVVVLGIILALSASSVLVACGKIGAKSADGEGASNSNIVSISTQYQEANGVTVPNFLVHIDSKVNWSGLSDDKRQKITDSAMNECRVRNQNQEGGRNIFNIIGFDQDTNQMLFMYNQENNSFIIFVDNKRTDTELPAPADPNDTTAVAK